MKLSEEGTFWICLWSLVALVICVIAITIGVCEFNYTRLLLKGGYEEVQKEGSAFTMWKKTGKD